MSLEDDPFRDRAALCLAREIVAALEFRCGKGVTGLNTYVGENDAQGRVGAAYRLIKTITGSVDLPEAGQHDKRPWRTSSQRNDYRRFEAYSERP